MPGCATSAGAGVRFCGCLDRGVARSSARLLGGNEAARQYERAIEMQQADAERRDRINRRTARRFANPSYVTSTGVRAV